jgi:hypothetical protein
MHHLFIKYTLVPQTLVAKYPQPSQQQWVSEPLRRGVVETAQQVPAKHDRIRGSVLQIASKIPTGKWVSEPAQTWCR